MYGQHLMHVAPQMHHRHAWFLLVFIIMPGRCPIVRSYVITATFSLYPIEPELASFERLSQANVKRNVAVVHVFGGRVAIVIDVPPQLEVVILAPNVAYLPQSCLLVGTQEEARES